MEKKILVVENLNKVREGICPECKKVMVWHPGGTDRHIGAGNLVEMDFKGCWVCSCGYHQEEK